MTDRTPEAACLLNMLNDDTEDPEIKPEISRTRTIAFTAAADLVPQ